MSPRIATFALLTSVLATTAAAQPVTRVTSSAELQAALRAAQAGSRIVIAPGRYQPGVYAANLKGTADRPIVIEGERPDELPLFEGGSQGWHLSNCEYVVLRNVAVRGARHNGINIDDGGTYETPARGILLENLQVEDIGPAGNFDGIKLSGVTDFVIRRCTVAGWGGQAVDMVGCHNGLIEQCTFRGKEGYSQHTGPQTKGGSSRIVVRRCLFIDAGGRAMQIGGSTGLAYFRPRGALYEAKDIVVAENVFIGGEAPVAFVGVDGAVFRNNTILYPRKWVLRILQETTEPGFAPCRNGRFEHNLVVFRAADVRVFANVGPNTQPETFRFANNLWYAEDRPAASRPALPVAEENGVYGVDPRIPAPGRGPLRREDFTPAEPRAQAYGALAAPPS